LHIVDFTSSSGRNRDGEFAMSYHLALFQL
jgi:hypothetical protein